MFFLRALQYQHARKRDEKMAQAGNGTIITMHQKEDFRQEAEKANINVVIAGHMSSDSLGMNLLMDELEKQGIEIVPCSGFTRFSRVFRVIDIASQNRTP